MTRFPTTSSACRPIVRLARAAGIASIVILAGCLGSSGSTISSPDAVRYAFVVLGVNGQAVARAITSAATCPALAVDGGRPVQMSMRAAAATLPPRPTAYDPHNTVPVEFPVAVCDTQLPAGAVRATIGARELPLPRSHPRKILVIGDTGCRMKSSDGVNQYQACNDPQQWPFRSIADLAAAQAPDVVIHVGDYHYRETACPAGDAGCRGSPYGFSWSSWEPDFFAPGQALLASAPWILIRGDHETCNRGGQGWWRLLDPRPLQGKRDCNEASNDSIGDFSEPYAVPIGDDTLYLVFDSAAAGSKALAPHDDAYKIYAQQFREVFALGGARPHAFFMNHQPILGYNSDLTATALPGNEALRSVLDGIIPGALFPANVEAVHSGHVHMLQVVSFDTPQPPIFISGNGGTSLVPDFTKFPAGDTPVPGAVVASFLATAQFGFMTVERGGAGWEVKSWDRQGKPLVSCRLVARKTACTRL